MYNQEKKDATQRKTLKHAGYRSKEKGTSVDARSLHPNLHKQSTLNKHNRSHHHGAIVTCIKQNTLRFFFAFLVEEFTPLRQIKFDYTAYFSKYCKSI